MVSRASAITGAKVDGVVFILGAATSFVFIPVCIGFLGIEKYGVFVSVQALVSLLSMADLGMGVYATKKLSGGSLRGEELKCLKNYQFFQYFLALCLFVFGALSVIALPTIFGYLNQFDVKVFFVFAWANYVLIVTLGLFKSVYRSTGRQATLNLLEFCIQLAFTLMATLLLAFDAGLVGLGVAMFVSTCIVYLFMAFDINRLHGLSFMSPVGAHFHGWIGDGLRYVASFQLIKLSHIAKTSMFIVFVASLCGPSVAGAYSVVSKVPQLTATLLSKIALNYMPRYSSLCRSGNEEVLKKEYASQLKIGIQVAIAAIAVLFFLNENFVTLWVGDVHLSFYANCLVLVNVSFVIMNAFFGVYFQASGNFGLVPKVGVCESLILFFLVSVYGATTIESLLILLAICSFFSMCCAARVVGKELGLSVSPFLLSTLVSILGFALPYAVLYSLIGDTEGILGFLLKSFGAVCCFAFFYWLALKKK